MHPPQVDFGLGSAQGGHPRGEEGAGRLGGGFKEAAMKLCRCCKEATTRLQGDFKDIAMTLPGGPKNAHGARKEAAHEIARWLHRGCTQTFVKEAARRLQ